MATPPGINDNFQLEGIWWLPEQEDVRVAGALSFSQKDGPILTIFGSFSTGSRRFGADLEDRAAIHGMTKDGKAVSLLDALHTSHQGGLTHNVVREIYKGHLLAIGYHFASEDEEIFTRSFVSFEDIEEWLGHRFFDLHASRDDVNWTLDIARFKDRLLAQIDDIALSAGTGFYTDSGTTNFTINASCYIKIAPAASKSLNWHLSAASKIQSLASLCTGRHLPLRSLMLDGPQIPYASGGSRPADVHLYASFPNPESQKARKYEMPLIRVADFPDPADQVFQRWFASYDELSSAVYLFLAALADRATFISARFTLAIQALEVFHRRSAPGTIIPKKDHTALKKTLVAAIPDDTLAAMREKLEGVLSFSNEPSLKLRVGALLKEVETSFSEAPEGYGGDFVARLVNTRNYYTHYSPKLEGKTLEGIDMHFAIRRIVLLLTMLLLVRIGVAPSKLRLAIGNHREFKQLWEKLGNPS